MQCTGCGKHFTDENGKIATEPENVTHKKLPVITDGRGQSINAGESKELSFCSDANYDDFIRVELDGNTVDEKNYTKREGSTIITLKAEYVASLPKGEHPISIVSTNGIASTSFALLEVSSSNEPASAPANAPVVIKAAENTSPQQVMVTILHCG